MDFKDIFDRWEKKQSAKHKDLDKLLSRYAPDAGVLHEKDKGLRVQLDPAMRTRELAERQRTLRLMPPQAVLDLHGKGAADALAAVEDFIADSARRGLDKVLIITGKGHHSIKGPILGPAVEEKLRSLRKVGLTGHPKGAWGGKGALWVILKR